MYSISKTPVSLETAQSLVSAHFGGQAHISQFSELTEGMYNSAYLIELADGFQCVLKVAPPEHVRVLSYEKNIIHAEVDVLRLLAARTSVPVPEVFASDFSHRLLANDYFLMAFVPGLGLHKLRPQLSSEAQHAVDFQTGEYLRQINQISGQAFGYYAQPEFHFSTWREAFGFMINLVLQDGRDAGVALPLPYDTLTANLQAAYGCLDAVTSPALVHWDLWDGNIFIDPQTHRITGFLDCERALWGDPLMEVNFGAFGLNPALLEGYGLDLLSQPGARARRLLYNIYLWLVMTIEPTYRYFETKDQENWARQKLSEDLQNLQEIVTR